MKKVVAIALMLSLLPLDLSAELFTDVKNESKTSDFAFSHTVSRESSFQTTVSTTLIDKAGTTKLGRIAIHNNTRDGYSLTVSSANDGNMHSATDDDGETDIPYSIQLTKDGDIGEGINAVTSITSAALSDEVVILEKADAAGTVSTPTNAEFIVNIVISDDGKAMDMAGSYEDTLTLTYSDL